MMRSPVCCVKPKKFIYPHCFDFFVLFLLFDSNLLFGCLNTILSEPCGRAQSIRKIICPLPVVNPIPTASNHFRSSHHQHIFIILTYTAFRVIIIYSCQNLNKLVSGTKSVLKLDMHSRSSFGRIKIKIDWSSPIQAIEKSSSDLFDSDFRLQLVLRACIENIDWKANRATFALSQSSLTLSISKRERREQVEETSFFSLMSMTSLSLGVQSSLSLTLFFDSLPSLSLSLASSALLDWMLVCVSHYYYLARPV